MNTIPDEPAKEHHNQQLYWQRQSSPLLLDYEKKESSLSARLVTSNNDWIAVVPFWAVWPFETLLLPRRHISRFQKLTIEERNSLSSILQILLIKYDNLFETSFPYSMGWHGAPNHGQEEEKWWQLHAHFYPPLLRSATIKKFLVGFEMLAEAQRDFTPEQAAEQLRNLPDIHYKQR
jgi:UDPglucose--hexose-1-phosphate uridylyltransferase